MPLPDRATVLIVGAGPAGLAAALSLVHHGFRDFIIVDAIAQGENLSRAMVIHPATLEALDTVGCVDEFISLGIKNTGATMRTRSTELMIPETESLTPYTRFPYVLIIPQNLTERILEEKLTSFGVIVHRPLRVVGLRRNATNPQLSDAVFEDGRVITTEYVIGADGARSTVRSMSGIRFSDPVNGKGETNSNLAQVVIADVTFDTVDADQSASSGTLSPDNFFICFPMPASFNKSLAANDRTPISETVYRIGCGVPLEDGKVPQSPSKEFLQDLVDRFGPYCLASDPAVNPNSKSTHIKDVIWSSRFRDRTAVADVMFTRLGSRGSGPGGVILLVGDAAHIHSPVGGQGMNLGIRDAIFLGKAITDHIRAAHGMPFMEADEILYEFAMARRARALEVIRLAQGLQSLVGMKHSERMFWWFPIDSETVRTWVLWVLGRIPFVRRKVAWELSGLSRR